MQTLHKYQILEKIGVGGFGVVYKATDPFIKRFVAIKTCTAMDAETRQRFVREAEIAGNLHHRNIVTVYDFGYHEETPYLVQEYLSGEDLDHKIRRREFLPLPTRIFYLVQIARGLEYAHRQGVIHRDIKPANIRILADDTAKIMDFGIAKLAQQQQNLTQAGITLGTAAYLAPEQIRGEPSDPRTDMFSFGALAYELLAGERPFAGAEISSIFFRILNEEATPLGRIVPDLPAELEAIVMRCLEKDPSKRFATSSELLRTLEDLARRRAPGGRITGELPVPPPRPSPPRSLVPPAPGAAPVARSDSPTVVTPAGGVPSTLLLDGAIRGTPADRSRGDEPLPGPTVVTPPPAPTAPPRARRAASLGEIELDSAPVASAPSGGGTNVDRAGAPVARASSGRVAARIARIAGVAVVLAAGWGAWTMRDRLFGSASVDSVPKAVASSASTTGSANAQLAVPATGPAAASPGSPPRLDGAAPPPGAIDTTAPSPASDSARGAPEVAPEPAAEPPKPGVLLVASAWDSRMTVRVGKKSWPLDRERRFELEPGSYRLKFQLHRPEYQRDEEKTVRLEAGETARVATPIARPGRLTVQPHLNTPQGVLRIDGRPVGPTPVRGRWIAPGAHLVEIAPTSAPDGPAAFRETVEIASERETLLTFDLGGQLARRIADRPLLPN